MGLCRGRKGCPAVSSEEDLEAKDTSVSLLGLSNGRPEGPHPQLGFYFRCVNRAEQICAGIQEPASN